MEKGVYENFLRQAWWKSRKEEKPFQTETENSTEFIREQKKGRRATRHTALVRRVSHRDALQLTPSWRTNRR
jgi:hypothetical protein